MVRQINKNTGEIRKIPPGGLYAPLPIPALNILAQEKQHTAARVLTCLVSHLGDNGWCVFPSYDLIRDKTGLSKNSIKPALDVLEMYGFIKVFRLQIARTKKRNKYYIQPCCYKTDLMPRHVRQKFKKTARCFRCIKELSRGEYSFGPNGGIHKGCGGQVISTTKQNKKQINAETT